jgi:predicted CXXCH cytochrome family protein
MAHVRRSVILPVLAAAILLSSSQLLAAEGGLNLEAAKDKTVEAFDKPNPHFELECSECHEGKPEFGKDTALTVKFVKDDKGDDGNVTLCYKCHDPSDNIHPINVNPAKGTPPVKIPNIFPLEVRGARKGEVVCSTCHFIHSKTAGLMLLRGFPESSTEEDLAKARFRDRRDLCKACHGDQLEKKSPHKGIDGDPKSCAFCHSKQPKKGEKAEFNKGLIELCDFCHAATKGAHYLLVNPFADPTLKGEIAKTKLPLMNGQYTCVSCHDPHGGTKEPKYLRDEFVTLALKSARIRPHFQQSFCLTCHKVKPKANKGAPDAQKLSEIPLLDPDPNKLCNRCHESGLSKANAHPITKVVKVGNMDYPSRIPPTWPLYQGTLTCLTCHTAGDSPVYDKTNPSFLRDGPFANRNDPCWKCHIREEFMAINPHLDINSGKGCEFCHDSKPDMSKSIDIEKLKFKGDIVILCIRCHDATAHPASIDHTVVPNKELMLQKNIKIPKEFPLDPKGRMTCATCHNPHAGGEKRGVVVGMEICSGCHPY